MERLETLLQDVERFADATARDVTREIVRELMDLHGEALAKVVSALERAGEPGRAVLDSLAREPVVASVLLLYGLHPTDMATRVRTTVAALRPLLHARGGEAELTGIEEGVVRLRISGADVRQAVEDAVAEAAPDASGVEFEVAPPISSRRLSLPLISDRPPAKNGHQPSPLTAPHLPFTPAPKEECCELCGRTLTPQHDHLLDPAARRLLCCCQACAFLFSGDAEQRYRRVPRRVERLSDFRLSEERWNGLMIPINLAFFSLDSKAGRVIALYPSPAGATESLLELETWQPLVGDNPVLAELQPDVEALLVNRVNGAGDYYRVSIDLCYELAGLIRSRWRGLSGGEDAWDAVAHFFAALEQRSPEY